MRAGQGESGPLCCGCSRICQAWVDNIGIASTERISLVDRHLKTRLGEERGLLDERSAL